MEQLLPHNGLGHVRLQRGQHNMMCAEVARLLVDDVRPCCSRCPEWDDTESTAVVHLSGSHVYGTLYTEKDMTVLLC